MSDDRYAREPGEDEEPYEPTADRTYVDPKPRSWYGPAPVKQPAFDLAAECDKFLDEFCSKFGIKRNTKAKEKRQEPPPEQVPAAPTVDDWSKLR